MDLWPAIDLRAGAAVRLLQGDYGAETVYGDPAEIAAAYVAAGARRLHLVDLDAARTGEPTNRGVIKALVNLVGPGVIVQVGGGVRDRSAAEGLLDAGVARVVLGTVAVEDPELVRRLAHKWPGRLVLGLDYRDTYGRQEVAVHGWTAGSGRDVSNVLATFADLPLAGIVATDISRDGTGAGPDLEGLERLLGLTALPVVASGGVAGASDLRALARLRVGDRRLEGVIVGKALLSGAISMAEAMAACADEDP
jgi:phosphoribosylformimino-5-aminoimidazole carboxamide ribotide isomerase